MDGLVVDISPFMQRLTAISVKMDASLAEAMTEAGDAIVSITRGNLYKHGQHDPEISRTTSPPGESPMMASGRLADSVRIFEQTRTGFGLYSVGVGAGVGGASNYARVQEEGMTIDAKGPKGMSFTYGGVRYAGLQSVTIPARPYFKPSVEESLPEIRSIISAAVERGLA